MGIVSVSISALGITTTAFSLQFAYNTSKI